MDIGVRPLGGNPPLLQLACPYDSGFLAWVKAVPGRRWMPDQKVWTVPAGSLRDLRIWAAKMGHRILTTSEIHSALRLSNETRSLLLDLRSQSDAGVILPTDTKLFPYQRAGVNYMTEALKLVGGALLADDMGLGKTVQALSVAVNGNFFPALVLCPNALKRTWAREIDKHYPQLRYVVIEGSPKQREDLWDQQVDVYIINYELLLRDAAPLLRQWNLVIADEVSFLKNFTAKRTKFAKRLKRKHSLGLSGIPIENHLEDLYSIYGFVLPGLLGSFAAFSASYIITRNGFTVGYRNLQDVRDRVAPYYIRHTKKQVLSQLPPKLYTDVDVDLGSAEWHIYNAVREQILEFVKENPRLKTANLLTLMLRLRQCADAVDILNMGDSSAKLDALGDVLAGLGDRQALIFTEFEQMALRIQKRFGGACLTGSSNVVVRQKTLDDFMAGKHPYLVCTDILSYGVTLTNADVVVHVEPSWNPAKMRQREDRTHRIGQMNPVNVVRLIARGTIEDYMLRKLYAKLATAGAVFDLDEDSVAASVSRSDIMAILQGD